MGVRDNLARIGNGNKIIEMNKAGMGPNQIVGVFADHGIHEVTRSVVVGVIASHVQLGVRALPNSAAKAAIKAHKGTDATGFDLAY